MQTHQTQMRTRALRHASRQAFRPARLLVVKTNAAVGQVAKASKIPSFPFVKIAGQEEMKLALLLNVVDPNIGGVLVMGDRGTGKSVAVSAENTQLRSNEIVLKDMGQDPLSTRWMCFAGQPHPPCSMQQSTRQQCTCAHGQPSSQSVPTNGI
jgi:predicted AAA+ superfamily ATPase